MKNFMLQDLYQICPKIRFWVQAKAFFLIFTLLTLELKASQDKSNTHSVLRKADTSDVLDKHPLIPLKLKSRIRPFLIPKNHPAKAILDSLFTNPHVLLSKQEFQKAGFEIISSNTLSRVIVARHPLIQGYLLKVYLFENHRHRLGESSAEGLVMRCEGAKKIQKLIEKKKIVHFSVPQKHLYIIPCHSIKLPEGSQFHPVVLIVEDMKIADFATSADIWRQNISRHHLQELYYLLTQGVGSTFLPGNIPYAKDNKFSFIDTEFPNRKNDLEKVKKYLSPKMSVVWDNLIKTKGKG